MSQLEACLQELIGQAELDANYRANRATGGIIQKPVPLTGVGALHAVESVTGRIQAISTSGGAVVAGTDDHIIPHFVEVLGRASFSSTGKLQNWEHVRDGYFSTNPSSRIRNIIDGHTSAFVRAFPEPYRRWAQQVADEAVRYIHSASLNQACDLMLNGAQLQAGGTQRIQRGSGSNVDKLMVHEAARQLADAVNSLQGGRSY